MSKGLDLIMEYFMAMNIDKFEKAWKLYEHEKKQSVNPFQFPHNFNIVRRMVEVGK